METKVETFFEKLDEGDYLNLAQLAKCILAVNNITGQVDTFIEKSANSEDLEKCEKLTILSVSDCFFGGTTILMRTVVFKVEFAYQVQED
jgi:hypothetical protein